MERYARANHLMACGMLLSMILAGCGSGSSNPRTVNVISGTITTDNFTIPAGQVDLARGDATVFASGAITINGTLQLAPGASITLFTPGAIVLHGSIQPQPTRRATLWRRILAKVGAAKAEAQTAPATPKPIVIDGGQVSGVAGSFIRSVPGQDIEIACNGQNSSLNINFDIDTPDGTDAFDRNTDGGSSGSIDIGSPHAREVAQGKKLSNADCSNITISGSLSTGNGGKGFSDLVGQPSVLGNVRDYHGTHGGSSGDIRVGEPNKFAGTAKTGRGGDGGSAGSGTHEADGRGPGAKGTSVTFTSGSGGDSGHIFGIRSAGIRGPGGNAGDVNVSPGNGANDSPPGDGGDATGIVGIAGFGKIGDDGRHADLSFSGGNGGNATVKCPNVAKGGDGGNLTIDLLEEPHTFTVNTFGNGGRGSDGCACAPKVRGGAGGDGGILTINPPGIIPAFLSFQGGSGGDGEGPGSGGKGGTSNSGQRFNDGPAGDLCNVVSPTPTVTPTPCVSCGTPTPTPTLTPTPTSTPTPVNRTATGVQFGMTLFNNGDNYNIVGRCVAPTGCTGSQSEDAPATASSVSGVTVPPFTTCDNPVSIPLTGGPPTVAVRDDDVVICAPNSSPVIQCVVSTDGGKTFGGVISPREASGISSAPVGVIDATLTFHVIYQHTDSNFGNLQLHAAHLLIGASSFNNTLNLGSPFDRGVDALAADLVDGGIYATITAADPNNRNNALLQVLKSSDGGASFGAPVAVGSVAAGGLRALTAKASSVFVVYGTNDSSNNTGSELGFLSTDGGASFTALGQQFSANGTLGQQTVEFLNGTEAPQSFSLSGVGSGFANQDAFYVRSDDSLVAGVQDANALHLKQNTASNPSSFSDIVISTDSGISGSACAGNDSYAVCAWPTSTGAPANSFVGFAARCHP